MSGAKGSGRTQHSLKSDSKGVFVPMTPERLRRVDADRAKLGLSRGGALAAIYDNLGSEAVDAAQRRSADAAATAESVAELVAPLIEAMAALDAAWAARAKQTQAIGVHSNQVARLANVERLAARDGDKAALQSFETLAHALQGVARALEAQTELERQDDALRAEVRAVLDRMRCAA